MNEYIDLYGREIDLSELESSERSLVAELLAAGAKKPEWNEYRNYFMAKVGDFYKGRGLNRRETLQTVGWRIGQDQSSRLGIAQGHIRPSDYRSEIERIIAEKFATRREFCEATGIAEDMLSHVLARRKDFSIHALADALDKIGYSLHVVPKSA